MKKPVLCILTAWVVVAAMVYFISGWNVAISGWDVAIWVYTLLAVITLVPVLRYRPGGERYKISRPAFEQAPVSADLAKRLSFFFDVWEVSFHRWKYQSKKYQFLHYYSLVWTLITAVLVPFLTQAIDERVPASKWLVTVIAAHAGLILAFNRTFRLERNVRAYSEALADLHTLNRRFLTNPQEFGVEEKDQFEKYYEEVRQMEKKVREETGGPPTLDPLPPEPPKPPQT